MPVFNAGVHLVPSEGVSVACERGKRQAMRSLSAVPIDSSDERSGIANIELTTVNIVTSLVANQERRHIGVIVLHLRHPSDKIEP